MVKFKYFSVLVLFVVALSSCKKDSDNADKQITDFIQKNNINAVKDGSGLYYQIIKPGSGSFTYPSNTQITIKYEGRLLNGNVFDNGGGKEQTFYLSQLIEGWKIGIPKIQKGGEIRLIIPPSLGYGDRAAGSIPANSVLDFTISLNNVQ
ncbi:FKBP-type peptidyl-prolyl cis-trans isomerase [Pedobacter rhizosphaerae]|uniref:Peptidyl-prolyl cis-trans isomerase n=1 Tax=Pedobacter rhizosphaerae TaxID=390241 RepID=A0A1H9L8U2_9SPHI|nr:FKBP-type peptidyl-prolyl cis-trans isomerase [Pedobacter rhizosphaerae]SER07941.1 FKBP-type peptidyl-prolyl cis-trans isomerase FkpA [Pedobacter rhizosphaerae]